MNDNRITGDLLRAVTEIQEAERKKVVKCILLSLNCNGFYLGDCAAVLDYEPSCNSYRLSLVSGEGGELVSGMYINKSEVQGIIDGSSYILRDIIARAIAEKLEPIALQAISINKYQK